MTRILLLPAGSLVLRPRVFVVVVSGGVGGGGGGAGGAGGSGCK